MAQKDVFLYFRYTKKTVLKLQWNIDEQGQYIGFIEAAESLEEAVRREAYEETGIIVNRVSYHSGQPWVIKTKINKSLTFIFSLSLIHWCSVFMRKRYLLKSPLRMMNLSQPDGLLDNKS